MRQGKADSVAKVVDYELLKVWVLLQLFILFELNFDVFYVQKPKKILFIHVLLFYLKKKKKTTFWLNNKGNIDLRLKKPQLKTNAILNEYLIINFEINYLSY